MDFGKTKMPFGKHKGTAFDDVPLDYLDWLVGQEWLTDPLKTKLERYLSHPDVAKELDKALAEKEARSDGAPF